MECKHKWKKILDYWECSDCLATKRIIKGVVIYWNKDGNRITNIEDDGEDDIAFVEEELKKFLKK